VEPGMAPGMAPGVLPASDGGDPTSSVPIPHQ